MAVNRDKPDRWKADIIQSVDYYNDWFLRFAPVAYRQERVKAIAQVQKALALTKYLTDFSPAILLENPGLLSFLRMTTCPPIARDRLIGLAGVPSSLVSCMEKACKLPTILSAQLLAIEIGKIGSVIEKLLDPDIFTWLSANSEPSADELLRASSIVADRLCGAAANPIVRNAQETRQLAFLGNWLEARGYRHISSGSGLHFRSMEQGTFCFRLNIPITMQGGKTVNIPIDAVIKPKDSTDDELPLLIEAKSAGDFTNVNKRRKEEATKVNQLRATYGANVCFILFLCGYFDSGYLGYEAAEGIDWVWEHRVDDLREFNL